MTMKLVRATTNFRIMEDNGVFLVVNRDTNENVSSFDTLEEAIEEAIDIEEKENGIWRLQK